MLTPIKVFNATFHAPKHKQLVLGIAQAETLQKYTVTP